MMRDAIPWPLGVICVDTARSAQPSAIAERSNRLICDTLDLRAAEISTVIWATGYRYDLKWIDCPVFDNQGAPEQRRGVTKVPGLYFLGLPRMHKVKSSFLWGVGEDAEYLANHIAAGSTNLNSSSR